MDKLDYIQRQNQQLRYDIQQLQQIIKMNKIQIDILSNQLQVHPNNTKKLMDIIISYRQRQQKLGSTINEYKKQISKLNTDNLVLRQLNDGQNIEMKNMQNLNLSAIELLNQKIKELQDKIAYYQKSHKQYDKISGFVLKNRDIVGPQDLALELKDKQYQWKDQLQLMKAQKQLAKINQQKLLVVNTVLRNKIVSLQAQLAMPNRNLGEVLDKSLKKLMLYFIEVQKKIITGEQDSQSDQQNDIQLIAPQLSGVFPQKKLRIQRDYGVPHLDLLKIRQQMNHSSNKIKQALIARNHLTDKQKVQRLEIQLEYTRRQLSKNIIDLRDQKDKRKKAQSMVKQLQARLDLLINSNLHLQAKVRKYWNKLKLEKQKGYSNTNTNIDIQDTLIDQELNTNNLQETLKIQSPKKKQKIQKQNRYGNPSLLLNQYQIDYKIHLQIMAQELKKNKKLDKLDKLRSSKRKQNQKQEKQKQQQQPKRLKRSTSNPLLYFNQRKADIMEIKDQGQNQDNQRQRLEQTCYQNGKNLGFQQVLQQLDI